MASVAMAMLFAHDPRLSRMSTGCDQLNKPMSTSSSRSSRARALARAPAGRRCGRRERESRSRHGLRSPLSRATCSSEIACKPAHASRLTIALNGCLTSLFAARRVRRPDNGIGAIAQLGERRVRNAEVRGSIPFAPLDSPPGSRSETERRGGRRTTHHPSSFVPAGVALCPHVSSNR